MERVERDGGKPSSPALPPCSEYTLETSQPQPLRHGVRYGGESRLSLRSLLHYMCLWRFLVVCRCMAPCFSQMQTKLHVVGRAPSTRRAVARCPRHLRKPNHSTKHANYDQLLNANEKSTKSLHAFATTA